MSVDLGLLILRGVVGLLFAAHGAQKVFGAFDGPGMEGHTGFMESLGLEPAGLWAWLSALAELVGGLLFAVGLLTPLAAAALVANMLVAIVLVHGENGLFNSDGGIEFPLTLATVALVVGLVGGGVYSVDAAANVGYPPLLDAGAMVLAFLTAGVAVLLTGGQEEAREAA
jgi:putative oxidoreductase